MNEHAMPMPAYDRLHAWELYSSEMKTEKQQTIEEGKDIHEFEALFDAIAEMPRCAEKARLADILYELIVKAPQRADYAYNEPSELEAIRALRPAGAGEKKPLPSLDVLKDKLAGAWYGRVAGCSLGKPVEGIRTNEFEPFLKETGNWPMHRFILSADGYILTNYHVVEDSNSITVSLYDGTEYDATLVGCDESNDIAVLKIDAEGLTPVVLGDSDNLNVGDQVVAIGNPLGELTFSLTTGVVSALDRPVTFSTGTTMNLIQTDCAINSGNSGGALFNLYGEVIGITNAKYSSSSSPSEASIDNIGFAIPLDQVRSIFESIITNGYIVKPYIGVTVSDVSAESQSYGLPQGAAVRSVTENGPAAEAGLQENDIITAANGETITSSNDLVKLVKAASAGDTLELTVYRQGQTLTLTLTVGEQKTDALPAQTTDQTQQSQQGYYDGGQSGQSDNQFGGSWPFGFGFGG